MSGHINIYRQKLSLCQDVLVSSNCYCYFNDHRAQWRALCVGTINEFAFLSTNKQKKNSEISGNFFLNAILKSKKRRHRKLHIVFETDLWYLAVNQCAAAAQSASAATRESAAQLQSSLESAQPREKERERESSVGASLCYLAALCLSLCPRSLARACTMRCLAECILNSMVGVADAHFANWNVYKPGEQLPQYSLLFTFASGLVSSGRSGVWFGP